MPVQDSSNGSAIYSLAAIHLSHSSIRLPPLKRSTQLYPSPPS